MHLCSFASIVIVNAEVDSMGGVIEGGLGVVDITSPHKEAVDNAQAQFRQECDVRDIRQRELEFLEKGGNPLDYELGSAASASVQSTSFVGQQPDKFVNCEVRCNFPYSASPNGDSVESSGRPGERPRESNASDNLLLFDAEPIFSEGDQNSLQPSRSETEPSERSVRVDGCPRNREQGDSATFSLPGKAYERRNRSRPNRDGSKFTSNDPSSAHGNNGSSLAAQTNSKDVKGSQSDGKLRMNWNLNPTNVMDDTPSESLLAEGVRLEPELGTLRSAESTKDMIPDVSADAALKPYPPKNFVDGKFKQGFRSAIKAPRQMDSSMTDVIQTEEEMTSAAVERNTSETAIELENRPTSKMNGKKEEAARDGHHNPTSPSVKGLDLESFSTQANTTNVGNNDYHMCTRVKSIVSNDDIRNRNVFSKGPRVSEYDKLDNKEKHIEGIESSTSVKTEEDSTCLSQQENKFSSGLVEELNLSLSDLKNRTRDNVIVSAANVSTVSESGRKCTDLVCNNPDFESEAVLPVNQNRITSSPDLVKSGSSNGIPPVLSGQSNSSGSELKVANKIDEDSILKEAQIMQAKRKRIAELSVRTSSIEIRQRAHWRYVLEEMAWMANDFAQERIWKVAAAAQISCRAAFSSCLRKQEQDFSVEVMKVAHKLARAVREFWLSASLKCEETKEELELQHQKKGALSVQDYAVRFLKSNRNTIFQDHMEVPLKPDRISDYGDFDMSVDSHFPEEKLFYTVPPGAIQAYQKSIESHLTYSERIGFSAPEVETSAGDAATAFGSEGIIYDEDDGDTSALQNCNSSRFTQLMRKGTNYAHGAKSYEMETDFVPMHSAKNQFVSQQPASVVKRLGSHLNASIPTKRVRTASRRVVTPLNAVDIQVKIPPDASSGETNSYQDYQSTPRDGLLFPNSLEVESAGYFEKQLPFDSAEVSTKPKKRKKSTHLNADYEENWHVDRTFHSDQFEMDHLKKRSAHLKSNGNIGLLGQPMMKKLKITRPHDSSFENIPPTGGSAPSPATTQMSNMSNTNKFIKILGGRDRLRNENGLKSPSGQLGFGSPWSLSEDQALVVLVHDLGPNWELVSDALSSTLRFKCIFRKAIECKDRHSALMDRTSGDGADSAEDSGSSHAYPSTLPGIPKGSARQLFQRLQGPLEEGTVKSHFEKIIMMMQKQRSRKGQDPKPIQTPHNSHALALSQVCPNNLNGGPVLTPLDLSDANPSEPEMLSMGYQGLHPSGLAVANQANGNPLLSSSNPSLQGSPSVISPRRPSSSMRHPSSRSVSLSAEEQQRLQMYNQIISGSMSSSPGVSSPNERRVRTLPGGNGVRMVGVNRSLPMVRPLLQGMSPTSMLNPGSVVSPSMSSNGHGSSVLRSREPSHNMMPGMGQMMSEHGSSQGMSQFGGGLNASYANHTSPPAPSYAISHPISLHQPHHPHVQGPPVNHSNAQQQAYAMRLAKEKQLQQRFLQQQQYAAASSSLVPNVRPHPQLPISSPIQNSTHVQPQSSSPSPLTTAASVPQQPQKPITPNSAVVRGISQPGGGSLGSPGGKQRQRQQQTQATNRQHPQQRSQLQAQQQGKIEKGVGSGNISIDSSLNGASKNPGTQSAGKGESGTNVMQSQSLYATSAASPVLPARQYVGASPPSSQSLPTQKLYPGRGSTSPTNLKAASHSNNHGRPVSSVGHQSLLPNQNQAGLQGVERPNSQVNSSLATKLPSKDLNIDQHSASSSSAMDPATQLLQATNSSANIAQAASPTNGHKWHTEEAEQVRESKALTSGSDLTSLVSTSSNLGQSVPQGGQGPDQKPALGSIPLVKHEVGEQFQLKQSQGQQPHSPVNKSPEQLKQPLQRTKSQQQMHLQQGGDGSMYGRSDDPL